MLLNFLSCSEKDGGKKPAPKKRLKKADPEALSKTRKLVADLKAKSSKLAKDFELHYPKGALALMKQMP